MNIESYRDFCLSFNGTSESFPFDTDTLVFKVMGKMFALTNVEIFESINLKCDPARAVQLRDEYEEIIPGWHMNKKHWNTVRVDGQLGDELIRELITHSYDLVVASLPNKEQLKLRTP